MTSTFKPGGVLDGGRQLLAIHRLARGAGGNDPNRHGLSLAGQGRKAGNGSGGGGNRFGLQAMRLVETVPEAGLLALLANRLNLIAGHIRHQQLHRVGADIDDRAADGFHAGRHKSRLAAFCKAFCLAARLLNAQNARSMKRTPLYAAHQRLGGKLIEFGGWEMPVQYTSITDEHLAVRKAAGLFDISHMGEVLLSGPGAEAFLNQTLTNDLRKLAAGQGQYTLMCNERGGVIDDLYAYRLAADEYLLIINASRIDADVAWLEQQLAAFPRRSEVKLQNASDATGALAVQGPRVVEFIDRCFPGPSTGGTLVARVTDLKKNQVASFRLAGDTPLDFAHRLHRRGWLRDRRAGPQPRGDLEQPSRRRPAPRVEARRPWRARHAAHRGLLPPLRPRTGRKHHSPSRRAWAFLSPSTRASSSGRSVLAEQKAKGPAKRLVAFKMTDRSAPPRPHYAIWSAGPAAARIGRSRERHPEPVARHWHRHGVCAAGIRQAQHPRRDRNPRQARPGGPRPQAHLSKTGLTARPLPDSIGLWLTFLRI